MRYPLGRIAFPRSEGRGSIEASLHVLALERDIYTFPRSEGRGSIEAAAARCPCEMAPLRFPRSEGRGSIEADLTVRPERARIVRFHVRKDVAPLKPRMSLSAALRHAAFPRSEGRGSIEALSWQSEHDHG